MAVTTTPAYPQAINFGIGQILPADTTTLKTIWTAGTNGSLLQALFVSSTDTSDRTLNFYVTRSATDYLLCTITATANSGNSVTVGSIDVLRHANWNGLMYDMAGNRQLRLKSGDVLKFASTGTITTAKAITAFADGEDL